MSKPKSISEYRLALKTAEANNARLEAEIVRLKYRVQKLEGQLEAAQRATSGRRRRFRAGNAMHAVGHPDDARAASMAGTRIGKHIRTGGRGAGSRASYSLPGLRRRAGGG